MKLIDLRKVRQVQKGSVAAGKAPKLDLGVLGITIGQQQSKGDTSRVTEEDFLGYTKRLVKDLNIKELGDGFYAKVFQHPTHKNIVVKVVNDDPDYMRYLAWCKKNQSNPYVPKIIGDIAYVSPDKKHKYHIVFLEKLGIMYDVDETRFMKQTGLKDFTDEPKLDDLSTDDLVQAARAGYFNKDLLSLWNHIKTYGPEKLDLHAGNIMMRGKQFVFIDPVGQGKS